MLPYSNKDMSKSILVTGSHRSGTTWVGKTISYCPKVAYINEPFSPLTYQLYRGRCGAKFIYWHTYITSENEADYYAHLKKTIEFHYNLIGQVQANKTFSDFKRTIREQSEFLSYRYKKCVPLLKDPLAIFSSEWLAKQFNMNVLVLIRHPAAFCQSLQRLGWAYNFSEFLNQPLLVRDFLLPFESEIVKHLDPNTNIIERACLLWRIIYSAVLEIKQRNPDWLYERYEDLAKEPNVRFKKLFENLDLEFSDSIDLYIKKHTESSNSNTVLKKDWAFNPRNSRDNIWTWKHHFSSEESALIRNLVEDVSSHFYNDEDW